VIPAKGLGEDEARALIAAASRVLQAAGQGDMVWGHVSVRDAEGRGLWIKGSGLGFDEVTEQDCALLSWEGHVLAGTAGRHVEYPVHTELMAARPDVGGVVHTHPLYSVAFASLGRPLRALSHEGAQFVPPDVPRFTRAGDLVNTPELGRALADVLGEGRGMASRRSRPRSARRWERRCTWSAPARSSCWPDRTRKAARKRRRRASAAARGTGSRRHGST
jgi:ribulose-5-phosphate 4-epimerase/fuculose-1-phosphate aldolase